MLMLNLVMDSASKNIEKGIPSERYHVTFQH